LQNIGYIDFNSIIPAIGADGGDDTGVDKTELAPGSGALTLLLESVAYICTQSIQTEKVERVCRPM
jgi:hypothetical protein